MKHLVKLSKFGGQFRISLPKQLVEDLSWKDVDFVILEDFKAGFLWVRRFIDGESLRGPSEVHRNGSD